MKHLVPYLNGELGRRGHSKVERHLQECPRCLRECQREKRMENLLVAEARKLERKSDALLTWPKLRLLLEREAIPVDRKRPWGPLAEYLRAGFKGLGSPKAARTFSEAIYWGKRAAIPAVIILVIVTLYQAFQVSPQPPLSASTTTTSDPPSILVRIKFGPDDAPLPEGYYPSTGSVCISPANNEVEIKWGWKLGENQC